MSVNCIVCIKNRRTSLLDCLCDDCRAQERLKQLWKPGALVTVRQKDSTTHTKFFITASGKPTPPQNFNFAKEWMEQGLLSDEAAAFIQAIMDGKHLQFRGEVR